MCLYQVQAALVLEEVIWAVSLSSLHEWHAGQEARCQHGPMALRQERCLLGVVILFIEYQITEACELAIFDFNTGNTGFLHISKPHQSSFFMAC